MWTREDYITVDQKMIALTTGNGVDYQDAYNAPKTTGVSFLGNTYGLSNACNIAITYINTLNTVVNNINAFYNVPLDANNNNLSAMLALNNTMLSAQTSISSPNNYIVSNIISLTNVFDGTYNSFINSVDSTGGGIKANIMVSVNTQYLPIVNFSKQYLSSIQTLINLIEVTIRKYLSSVASMQYSVNAINAKQMTESYMTPSAIARKNSSSNYANQSYGVLEIYMRQITKNNTKYTTATGKNENMPPNQIEGKQFDMIYYAPFKLQSFGTIQKP